MRTILVISLISYIIVVGISLIILMSAGGGFNKKTFNVIGAYLNEVF